MECLKKSRMLIKKNIENKDVTLKVIHHRLRSAWCTPSRPHGAPDNAVEVFNNKLKYNVVDIIDKEAGRQVVLVVDFIGDKIKCVMKNRSNLGVYDTEFSCDYNEPYEYHETLCDAMESWEFLFECNCEKPMTEKFGMITSASQKNSSEVLEKVKKLQPEIDMLIEKEYIKSVEKWLDTIEEHISDAIESIKRDKKYRIKTPKYKLTELKEMKKAAKLKGKEREQYIIDKAHRNMSMFGSCHRIWNTQKMILKEVYNIDWLTPAEEHPEIMFD